MSEEKQLFPDIPEEIRGANIGTCYDPITRTLISDKLAIDPSKLEESAVNFINGIGELFLDANSSTEKSAEDSFFGADIKVKSGWATIGFKTSFSSFKSNNNESLNCYCSYVYKGQKLQLYNVGSKKLFKYMSDEFQEEFTKVIKSRSTSEYLSNYFNFISKFGYGCVTSLYLTSGSAFEIRIKYSDAEKADSSKYGAEIAVATPLAGGAVAAEFANGIRKADSSASIYVIAKQIPQDTPTKNWCFAMMDKVIDAGLEKLSKTPTLIEPYSGDGPKAPEIPVGIPSTKEIPTGKSFNVTNEIKKEIMQKDNFNGTWTQYQDAQNNLYNDLIANKIVEEGKNANTIEKNMRARRPVLYGTRSNLDFIEYEANENTSSSKSSTLWNLGQYMPFDYEVTAWNKLFPELNAINIPTTFTSMYISKIFMYYLTRVQFSRYLYFLSDVGGELCKNTSINDDADIFREECNKLLSRIQSMISSNKKFDKIDYISIMSDFETRINNLRPFFSKKVYKYFYDNYIFFVENAYGFIVTLNGSYYIDGGKGKEFPTPFSLLPMMKDASRAYPVVRQDGSIILAGFELGRWRMNAYIWNTKLIDCSGYSYYSTKSQASGEPGMIELFGVGFDDIPNNMKSLSIRGLPMIDDLPFKEVREFAKPNF